MNLAAAITGFVQTDMVWIQMERAAGRQGIVKPTEVYRQNVTGLVTESSLRDLRLAPDATTIQDDVEMHYPGELLSERLNRLPRPNDIFLVPAVNGKAYRVRLTRYRPEGGFTRVSLKYVDREDINV